MTEAIYQEINERQAREEAPEDNVAPKEFNKEEYAAKKKTERDAVFAMLDKATSRVAQDPAAYRDCLDVMARFPNYSASNVLLVFRQKPDAIRLADFNTWKRRNESVKRGQDAILVLEPGDEYTRDDGTIGVSINVRKVFDESQTTARHIEPRHPSTEELLKAIIKSTPMSIRAVEVVSQEKTDAYYDHTKQEIQVKQGLSEPDLFRALVIENAFAEMAKIDGCYSRNSAIETAYLTSYVLAMRYGVKDAQIMPPVSVSLPDKPLTETRMEIARVREVSKAISERMETKLERSAVKGAAPKVVSRGGRDVR